MKYWVVLIIACSCWTGSAARCRGWSRGRRTTLWRQSGGSWRSIELTGAATSRRASSRRPSSRRTSTRCRRSCASLGARLTCPPRASSCLTLLALGRASKTLRRALKNGSSTRWWGAWCFVIVVDYVKKKIFLLWFSLSTPIFWQLWPLSRFSAVHITFGWIQRVIWRVEVGVLNCHEITDNNFQ